MLQEMDLEDIDDLFSDIPDKFQLKEDLDISRFSELELKRHVKDLLSKNSPYTEAISFLGGGVWPHHVPSHVQNLTSRSEFLTSYTPYQAEASQGMLQVLFEYQSMISQLTGMEVANSSTYDWASSLGEAALMSARLTDRDKFLVPEFMSPDRLSVLSSYTSGPDLEVVKVPQDKQTGQIIISDLEEALDGDTSGVYIENPNYLGHIETKSEQIARITKDSGALFIVGVNPISLGILKPPGEYGADIVIGEGQPLGNPVNFGGPSLGIFACRGDREFIRQMPGRIVGMAETEEGGTRGFCMVLQTREQHIRRKKATSNLCTNQALNATAATIYMSSLGPKGLREVSEKCTKNAHYLMESMEDIEGVSAPRFDAPHFNEFVVSFEGSDKSVEEINSKLLERGIHGGKPISSEFPDLGESSLWCSTELHSREDMDWLLQSLEDILEE
ncbi:hypothetical protein AKJ55_01160 [candidate division MSBL1 archaeon SCGC-AAA382M17]|uniref:Probable glycine dehydrogenase (decarboxylating) subunit 1 n=1 Tax=candidate division MSBL1 archaeon SCGC-AAA382M17 TaxID=1698284 RepID=A0ABR5TJI3_9EURY|nr:hypothetical protein AKJ55_01160 [candidate division MSBL1 archaeon SCGC-AAA382M17]